MGRLPGAASRPGGVSLPTGARFNMSTETGSRARGHRQLSRHSERHRVLDWALGRLEPCAMKAARTVLRGGRGGNAASLLGDYGIYYDFYSAGQFRQTTRSHAGTRKEQSSRE